MVQQGRGRGSAWNGHVECFIVAAHLADMRDLFEDVFKNQPLDPTEMARRSMRPQLRRRFYQRVEIEAADGAFRIVLDGRPVRTPARHALAAPTRALAQALAAEWEAQREVDRSRQDAADPARQYHHRWRRRGAGRGGRGSGAISRLRSRVLSRVGSRRPGRAAGGGLGPRARLGARCARRALRAGARESSSSPSPRRRLPPPAPPFRARRGRSARCIRSPRSRARR